MLKINIKKYLIKYKKQIQFIKNGVNHSKLHQNNFLMHNQFKINKIVNKLLKIYNL